MNSCQGGGQYHGCFQARFFSSDSSLGKVTAYHTPWLLPLTVDRGHLQGVIVVSDTQIERRHASGGEETPKKDTDH